MTKNASMNSKRYRCCGTTHRFEDEPACRGWSTTDRITGKRFNLNCMRVSAWVLAMAVICAVGATNIVLPDAILGYLDRHPDLDAATKIAWYDVADAPLTGPLRLGYEFVAGNKPCGWYRRNVERYDYLVSLVVITYAVIIASVWCEAMERYVAADDEGRFDMHRRWNRWYWIAMFSTTAVVQWIFGNELAAVSKWMSGNLPNMCEALGDRCIYAMVGFAWVACLCMCARFENAWNKLQLERDRFLMERSQALAKREE